MRLAALLLSGGLVLAAGLIVWLLPGLVRSVVLNGPAHGSAKASVPPSDRYELLSLQTSDGIRIAAQFGRAESADGEIRPDYGQRPTAVYCYPGGGYLKWSHAQFEGLRRLGWNVIMPEYPGYGLSDGRPSEEGCYAAAEAAYGYVAAREDLDRTRILGVGWSVGAACVTDLATRRPLAGLVLIGAVTNLPDAVRHVAGTHPPLSWIPDHWLGGSPADSETRQRGQAAADQPPGHTVICGASDAIISPAMTRRLVSAMPGRSTMVLINGAGHFDLFRKAEREVWRRDFGLGENDRALMGLIFA